MNPIFLKAGAAALKNPEGAKKLIKKLLILAIAPIFVFCFLIGLLMQLLFPSNSAGEPVQMYQSIQSTYTKYNKEVRDIALKEKAEAYQKENPDEKILVTRYKVHTAFLSAYLFTKHPDLIDSIENYVFDEQELYDFLEFATYYTEETDEEGVYHFTSGIKDLQELFDFFPEEEDRRTFQYFYEMAINSEEYFEATENTQECSEFLKSLRKKSYHGDVPHYLQYDSQWSDLPIMGGNIASSGCNITCVAMVASYFLNEEILPSDVQEWAWDGGRNPYYVAPYGASFALYPAAAEHFGLDMKDLGTDIEAVVSELEQGHIVVASAGPGIFTKGGHLIVLRGLDEDGNILVNDPNDNDSKNYYNTPFSPAVIARECYHGFWSFWKDGFVPADDEIYLGAQIIGLEAGGTGADGMAAVAEVIRNRVASDTFPNSVTEVITAPNQFETYGMIDGYEPSEEQLQIFADVMSGELSVLNDPECLYFCSRAYFDSQGKFDGSFWGKMKMIAEYGNCFFVP